MLHPQDQSNAREVLDLYYKVTEDVAAGKANPAEREMLEERMMCFRSSLGFTNDYRIDQFYNWVNDTVQLCRLIISRPL